jgi:hypothetical protein
MPAHNREARPRRRGVSLAKGPVGLIGLASLAFGVLGFIFANQSFTMHAPSGTVNGGTFLGIEGNGWTWLLFVVGGLLLALSAPAHWGAKSMAFIVGLAAGAASVIAMVDGDDVFGIFAANGPTELVLGLAAVALLVLALLPRVGKKRAAAPPDRGPQRIAEPESTTRGERLAAQEDERVSAGGRGEGAVDPNRRY